MRRHNRTQTYGEGLCNYGYLPIAIRIHLACSAAVSMDRGDFNSHQQTGMFSIVEEVPPCVNTHYINRTSFVLYRYWACTVMSSPDIDHGTGQKYLIDAYRCVQFPYSPIRRDESNRACYRHRVRIVSFPPTSCRSRL